MVNSGKRKRIVRRQSVDSDDEYSGDDVPTQRQRMSQPPPLMSDDDEGALDFTQPSLPEPLSQAPSVMDEPHEEGKGVPARIGQLSKKTINDLTARVVRFLLYKAQANLPVRFADIGKEALPNESKVSRYFLKLASAELEKVFGYKVVAVDEILPNGSGKKDIYLIINAIQDQAHLLHINKAYGKVTRGLLMTILAFIWCAPSRRLVEEDLWKQLLLVDSSVTNTPGRHPQLGDVQQHIKTFEAQMYLASDTEIDGDGKRIKFFTYGARAFAEVGKVQILTFMCKLIHNRPPSAEMLHELAIEMRNERE